MKAARPVLAIFLRDLRNWFTNPTGYVFITLFVFLCAFALFIPARFFQENSAGLAPLAEWFRYLLLFFVPAVTMVVWAGERSQGTDEILLTLPASDGQIVLGKYLAAAGVYTLSLAFTFLVPIWVQLLGDPDWGLVLGTYLSFWLLGLFLIGVGMVGSQLTDNLTVAFILGAMLCAAIVFAEDVLGFLGPQLAGGPVALFEEMGRGVVSLEAVAFFVGGTAAILYLNFLLLARRRWRGARSAMHLGVRLASVVVGVLALTVLLGRWGPRLDTTEERLHSLSDKTRGILDGLDPSRPVTIRAWISPEVPRDLVATRRSLIDLLREYDALGGEAVEVAVIETTSDSEAASDAETDFGVRHRTVFAEEGSRRREFDVFLGVAMTCGAEETVIPYFDKGLSVEYELTRSLRVVAGASRPRIGILDTDARVFGGMDFQTYRQSPRWEIVRELELQYDVESVAPDAPYPPELRMLLVPMVSSLTQSQMDRLAAAIRGGTPAFLLDDPFPSFRMDLAPTAPKRAPQNPMMRERRPPEQKGEVVGFYRALGIDWDPHRVAWDAYNPHPDLGVEPELVFVGTASGSTAPFNPDEAITSGLQELLVLFGGCARSAYVKDLEFVPLLRTSKESGTLDDRDLVTRSMLGMSLNRNRIHRVSRDELVMACRVRRSDTDPWSLLRRAADAGGALGRRDLDAVADVARDLKRRLERRAEEAKQEKKDEKDDDGPTVDVIFVPDLDMINLSDLWALRRMGHDEYRFDNVTFLLNCVDALVGEDSFITLRKRRPKDRTLTTIEEQESEYREAWREERDAAEKGAKEELDEAQKRLDAAVKEIMDRDDMDERAKEIEIGSRKEGEQRRLDARREAIENRKNRRIKRARVVLHSRVTSIQNRYRFLAVGISPVPAMLAGLLILVVRRRRERLAVPASRSVTGGES